MAEDKAEPQLPTGEAGELELGLPTEAEDEPELELHTGAEDEAEVDSHTRADYLADEGVAEDKAEPQLPTGEAGELELGLPTEAKDEPELELHTGAEDEAEVDSHTQILWLMRLWLKLLVDDWRLVMNWLMWMAEEGNILP